MDFNRKKILGFDFVQAGYFYSSGTPYVIQRGARKGQAWEVDTAIHFLDERFLLSDESVYLIFGYGDDTPKYVGEYTFYLQDRWVKKANGFYYADHHMVEKIDSLLKTNDQAPNEERSTLWVAIDPFVVFPDSRRVNISKTLEYEIIKQYRPKWNIRGQASLRNI